MLDRTKTLYEVQGWLDAENPQEPNSRSTWTRKRDAMDIARSIKKNYNLVEINKLSVTPWDENDIHGCELLHSWTYGKKTA